MKAFVTGSTGLLGNNLVHELVRSGYEVKALGRSREKAVQVLGDLPVTIVQGDIADVGAWSAELEGCDVLFHTAAYFREYFQPGDHWQTLETINVKATLALLAEAEQRGVKKVIYTSSSGVLGSAAPGKPSDETTPPDAATMENLYFKSKVLAEEQIQEFLKCSSLPVVLILPGWMFGPGDWAPTSSGRLVLDFINRRLPGVIDGGGAPVDARDVVRAMVNAVERGRSGERYIVGGDRFVSFAEFNALLAEVSGVRAPRLRIPYGPLLVYAWLSERYSRWSGKPALITVSAIKTVRERHITSSAKAVRELGATFRPLRETLRDEVEWFRTHRRDLVGSKSAAPRLATS